MVTARSWACEWPPPRAGRGGGEFLADLVARGLTGVRLVTSDAHTGPGQAIAAHLTTITPKNASTQRSAVAPTQ